jgi:hypothetical protein
MDLTLKSSAKFDSDFLLDHMRPELLDTVRFNSSIHGSNPRIAKKDFDWLCKASVPYLSWLK